jgi:hypothetical protein
VDHHITGRRLCRAHLHRPAWADDAAHVADLAAPLRVEGGAIQHQPNLGVGGIGRGHGLASLAHVLHRRPVHDQPVVAFEAHVDGGQLGAGLFPEAAAAPTALALGPQRLGETLGVDLVAGGGGHLLGELKGESERVVEAEGRRPVERPLAVALQPRQLLVQKFQAAGERA